MKLRLELTIDSHCDKIIKDVMRNKIIYFFNIILNRQCYKFDYNFRITRKGKQAFVECYIYEVCYRKLLDEFEKYVKKLPFDIVCTNFKIDVIEE